ncbi:DUF3021 domain-containing protein [Oceanobacillus sp. FSL H7-0719]|uniref:DUF3021 domain-containing protein n=1 Tax=Oceanobacillus sp. FSL H7-0719 TaxID=2954507 RepID=UPI00324DD2D6
MFVEAIKRSMNGIAFAGIITFAALTVLKFTGTEATVSEIWIHMLLSLIIGIYFGLSSFIFMFNEMSTLKQTGIHFIMSLTVYFIIALLGDWVPLKLVPMLWTSLFFIVIYAVFWTGYYLYYKRIEETLNANLPKKE